MSRYAVHSLQLTRAKCEQSFTKGFFGAWDTKPSIHRNTFANENTTFQAFATTSGYIAQKMLYMQHSTWNLANTAMSKAICRMNITMNSRALIIYIYYKETKHTLIHVARIHAPQILSSPSHSEITKQDDTQNENTLWKVILTGSKDCFDIWRFSKAKL